MTSLSKLTRRGFVAAQATAMVGVGLTGQASAATSPQRPSWETATAPALKPLIGTGFTGLTAAGEALDLTLVALEAVKSGPARPSTLRRKEGTVVVFDCAKASALIEHQTIRIAHPALGRFDLFVGAVPTRSGGHRVEAVLN